MYVITPDEAQAALAGAQQLWDNATMPVITLFDFMVAMWTIIALVLARHLLRQWVKRKGFRMILKDRNQKKHAIWLEIIQDGLDDRLGKQVISSKEHREMLADAAKRMGLLDLVSKKKIAPIVKETLKRDRHKRQQARSKGEYIERAPIPGDKPTPIVKEKFSKRVGRAARFLSGKAA